MSNRVEELESKVAELRATVDGLTEELVETKERLRQVESVTEDPARSRTGRSGAAGTRDEGNIPEETQESDDGAESEFDRESESESGSEDSDIIVA